MGPRRYFVLRTPHMAVDSNEAGNQVRLLRVYIGWAAISHVYVVSKPNLGMGHVWEYEDRRISTA